jgi:hypothetical protein
MQVGRASESKRWRDRQLHPRARTDGSGRARRATGCPRTCGHIAVGHDPDVPFEGRAGRLARALAAARRPARVREKSGECFIVASSSPTPRSHGVRRPPRSEGVRGIELEVGDAAGQIALLARTMNPRSRRTWRRRHAFPLAHDREGDHQRTQVPHADVRRGDGDGGRHSGSAADRAGGAGRGHCRRVGRPGRDRPADHRRSAGAAAGSRLGTRSSTPPRARPGTPGVCAAAYGRWAYGADSSARLDPPWTGRV